MQASIKIPGKKERLETANLLRNYAKRILTEKENPAFCLISIGRDTTGQLVGEPREALALTLSTIAEFLLHLKKSQEPAVREVLKIVLDDKPILENKEFERSFK